MRMTGESTHEIVVDASGKVGDVRLVGTTFMIFAQSADAALRRTTYFPATLEGRPVASRFWVRVPFGDPQGIESTPARNRVTAYVPGSESPRARWQLADSVRRVTVVADAASAPPAEVSVVAIDPAGAERVLVKAGKASNRRLAMTVRTHDFFAKAGSYRIQLRHADRPIAEGDFTVADDEKSAVVNACGAP
jgi:hypothetical protein